MAYVNLINITCTDKEEFFQRMRDFICRRNGTYDYSATGIGWTLHDAVYATDEDNCAINDYFVAYSPGESGDEDIYIRIKWTNGYINCNGFQSWDNTAHTGSSNGFSTTVNNFTVAESDDYKISIYGNLDQVIAGNDIRIANAYCIGFGKLDAAWDDIAETVANCSSTLSAGSDVEITVDSVPAEWEVGKEIFIRTTHNDAMSTVKIEKIEIKTLVGNVITADLVNSYTADSKLSDFNGYFSMRTNNFMYQIHTLISEAGLVNQYFGAAKLALTTTYFDPGPLDDRFSMIETYYQDDTNGMAGKVTIIKNVPVVVAGWAIGDVLIEKDGTEWRFFQGYSSATWAVKEV